MNLKPLELGVFASGRGSNFLALLNAVEENHLHARVRLLVSNNPAAGALETATERSIPCAVISRQEFDTRDAFVNRMLEILENHGVEFIALAGYMKKIPPEVTEKYKNQMVNIHPALLPSFGGKGMYGHHVHEAVLERGCRVTGVTVHLVDTQYDHGPIVAQRCVPVEEDDTPESLAARVLKTEHQLYPEALELFASGRIHVRKGRVRILPPVKGN